MSPFSSIVFLTAAALLTSCASQPNTDTEKPSTEEVRAIAREAYTYAFPLVESYKTLYKQAVDTTSPYFQAPRNRLGHSRKVASPADKFVVTPNSDTPYSYAWLDLREDPVVITMPMIEADRYYSAQLIDMYSHNHGYLGTRTYGNNGGDFLITGPGWKGEEPAGITATIACETSLMYALIRTQLFNTADLPRVHAIQDGYQVRTLSAYQGKPEPIAAPIAWPAPTEGMTEHAHVFGYFNFLMDFCPIHPSEVELMARFAKIGIGAGRPFDPNSLAPEELAAVEAGIADVVNVDVPKVMAQVNNGVLTSGDVFGTREFLKNNYLYRFLGAKLGLYGNSRDEAYYPAYFVDAENEPLNGGNSYELRFEKDQLPPAGAFWSITMYDGGSQFLVENPLDRYLLNSTMLNTLTFNKDGSLSILFQERSPGKGKEQNWLPAPAGPFYLMMRIYLPKAEALDGNWQKPDLRKIS